jgi:lipoprotein-anchoring transpeptidase ErfK/SrfK
MKNINYLKKYVEDHPKNKMSWYLLGKEYEASDQIGKAHYCYMKAGEVYEAFESTSIRSEVLDEYKEGLVEQTKRKESQSRLFRKISLILLFILLLWAPSAHAPGEDVVISDWIDQGQLSKDGDLATTEVALSKKGEEKPLTPQVISDGSLFTARGYMGTAGQRIQSIGNLLDTSIDGPEAIHVLGMGKSGDYWVWSKEMPIVYGIKQNKQTGVTILQSYDKNYCKCDTPDTTKLQKEAKVWVDRQESLAVLSSAITSYKEHTGNYPKELSSLTQPFPNNWLAGLDRVMEQEFEPLLHKIITNEQRGVGRKAQGTKTETKPSQRETGRLLVKSQQFTPGNGPYFTKPLEIIVDKKLHQLMVVSGQVVLRSYKVGLGGAKTPEGQFQISDKVINPNGRSDGEFGSRGMQLSDTNYAIHGTNEPSSMGKDLSLGCVRMLKEDVEELFDLVPKGSKVTITSQSLVPLQNVPEERFKISKRQDQTNSNKIYRWLN